MKKTLLLLLSAVMLSGAPQSRKVTVDFTVTQEMDDAAALHGVTVETILADAGKAAVANIVATAPAQRIASIEQDKAKVLPKDQAVIDAAVKARDAEVAAADATLSAAIKAVLPK